MKWFALLGLLLFLGVTVAPAIHTNITNDRTGCVISPLFTIRSTSASSNNNQKITPAYLNDHVDPNITFPKQTSLDTTTRHLLRWFTKIDTQTRKDMFESLRVLYKNDITTKPIDKENLTKKYTQIDSLFQLTDGTKNITVSGGYTGIKCLIYKILQIIGNALFLIQFLVYLFYFLLEIFTPTSGCHTSSSPSCTYECRIDNRDIDQWKY